MSSRLSVRQLLACMDVSVFKDETAFALERLEDRRSAGIEERRSLFENALLFVGMTGTFVSAVLSCCGFDYWGWTGLGLALLFFELYSFIPVVWGRCLCWAYFSAGAFLCASAISFEAPFAGMAAGFLFLFLSHKKTDDPLCRIFSTLLCCLVFTESALASGGNMPSYVIFALSFGGFILCAFPRFNVFSREAVYIFLTYPLAFLAGIDAAELGGGLADVSLLWASLCFSCEFLLLMWALRKETDRREKALCFSLVLLALVSSFAVSAGLVGAAALFCLAFLADSRGLGIFAAGSAAVFCGLYLLALTWDLREAAILSLSLFGILFLIQFRLKILIKRVREGRNR